MNVIRHSADAHWRAVELLGDAAEVMVHFIAEFGVLEKRTALFRREHDVDEDVRQRLRHGCNPYSWAHERIITPKAFHHTAQGCRAAATLGKRFITQPRVAAWRLPWGRIITPKAVHHTAQ